jgi:hypothetical protein
VCRNIVRVDSSPRRRSFIAARTRPVTSAAVAQARPRAGEVPLADAAGWDATRRERTARSALCHRDCGRPEVIAGRYSATGVQAANRHPGKWPRADVPDSRRTLENGVPAVLLAAGRGGPMGRVEWRDGRWGIVEGARPAAGGVSGAAYRSHSFSANRSGVVITSSEGPER